MNKATLYSNFRLFVLLGLSLVLTACDNGNSSSEKSEQASIPEINQSSIGSFSLHFQQDYDDSLNSLLTHFEIAQKNDDAYSFVDFRNNKWTPVYINKKNFYSAVFEQNKAYLKSSAIAPMFNHFDKLIYIGLDLKNGLLNNNQDMIDRALLDAKNDQQAMHSIVAKGK